MNYGSSDFFHLKTRNVIPANGITKITKIKPGNPNAKLQIKCFVSQHFVCKSLKSKTSSLMFQQLKKFKSPFEKDEYCINKIVTKLTNKSHFKVTLLHNTILNKITII